MVTVMVFGTFDFVHLGHLNFFEQAKRLGSKLIVVVSRDSNVKRIKGKQPFFSEMERLKLVSSLKPVDFAVLGNSEDFFTAVKRYRPNVIALGYDQKTMPVKYIEDKLWQFGLKTRVVRLKRFRAHKHKSSALKSFHGIN